MEYNDKMYFINCLKSCFELLNKTKIGMKIFIISFSIFINFILLVGLGIGGIHFITIILLDIFLFHTTGTVYILYKIQNKYREKYKKDDIIKNTEETHSILVEGVPSTTTEVARNYIYNNDPDYKKEHAKWAKNFIIYDLGILALLYLSVVFL